MLARYMVAQVQCHHPYGRGPYGLFYLVEVELTILAWMWSTQYEKTWIITGSNLHPGSAFRNFYNPAQTWHVHLELVDLKVLNA